MRIGSDSELGRMIIKILAESPGETSLSDLLNRLHQLESQSVDDTAIKAEVWHLVARGDVELTSRRALRVHGTTYLPGLALAK